MDHKTKEYVLGDYRFMWAGSSTFISVRPVDAPINSVPYDMVELPDWVIASKLDEDGFHTLCHRWLRQVFPNG